MQVQEQEQEQEQALWIWDAPPYKQEQEAAQQRGRAGARRPAQELPLGPLAFGLWGFCGACSPAAACPPPTPHPPRAAACPCSLRWGTVANALNGRVFGPAVGPLLWIPDKSNAHPVVGITRQIVVAGLVHVEPLQANLMAAVGGIAPAVSDA